MLEHLANLPHYDPPAVPVRLLNLCISDIRSYTAARQGIQTLSESGYLDQKGICAGLTQTGLAALCETDEWYQCHRPKLRTTQTQQINRDLRRAEVMSVCAGAGVACYRKYKPSLQQLHGIWTGKTNTMHWKGYHTVGAKELNRLLLCGIYYSPSEVRQLLNQTAGDETVYSSQFCGVILTHGGLILLYNTSNRLVYWNEQSERMLYNTLLHVLPVPAKDSPVRCTAIIVGSGLFLLPSLVMGFFGGQIKNPASADDKFRQAQYKLLCARIGIFDNLYYTTVSRQGCPDIAGIISAQNTATSPTRIYEQESAIAPVIVYLPLCDLRSLAKLRQSRHSCIVYTPDTLAPFVSHSLGDVFLQARDISSGMVIETPLYDRYGQCLTITRREYNPAYSTKSLIGVTGYLTAKEYIAFLNLSIKMGQNPSLLSSQIMRQMTHNN